MRKPVASGSSLTKEDIQPKSPVKNTSPLKSANNFLPPNSPSIPFIDKSSAESLPVASQSPVSSTSGSTADLPRYKVEIPSRFSPVKKAAPRKFSPAVSSAVALTSVAASKHSNPMLESAAVPLAAVSLKSSERKSPKPILEKFKAMREEVCAEKREPVTASARPENQMPVTSIKGRIKNLESFLSQKVPEPPSPAPEMLPLRHKKFLFEKKIRQESGERDAGIKRNEYLSQKRGRSESKLPVVSEGIVAKMQQKILAAQSCDQTDGHVEPVATETCAVAVDTVDEIEETAHSMYDTKGTHSSQGRNEFEQMNEESALAAFFDIDKMETGSVDTEPVHESEDQYFSKPEKSSDADTMSVCTQSSQSDGDFDSLPSSPAKSTSSSNKMYPDLPVEQFDETEDHSAFPSSPKKLRFCDDIQSAPTPERAVGSASQDATASGSTPLRTLSMYRLEQRQRHHDAPLSSQKVVFEPNKRALLVSGPTEDERVTSLRRQIHELKNQEVPRCVAIANQSVQALKACLLSEFRDTSAHADAERHVLVSNIKRVAAMNEIHALNAQLTSPLPKESVGGHLTIQRLDLPIMRDTILAHKKGLSTKSPDSQYYFCVASAGPTVHSTECLAFSDGYSSGFLSFNLHSGFAFNHLRANFQLRLDVYEVSLQKPGKKESGRSMRLTPKKHAGHSVAGPTEKQEPLAQLKGSVMINVKNIKKKDFDLQNFRFESSLQGSIRIALTVAPEYKNEYSNFLNFYDEKVDIGTWKRRWCHVKGAIIRFWRLPEDQEAEKKPLGEIDLRHCINPTVEPAPYDVCPRKESFVLVFAGTATDKTRLRVNWLVNKNYRDVIERSLMAADVVEERDEWISVLNNALDGMRVWDEEALIPCTPSEIQTYINV